MPNLESKSKVFQHLFHANQQTPFKLHQAAFLNDVALLKQTIANEISHYPEKISYEAKVMLYINNKDSLTNTALHYAALNNSADAIEYLISVGVPVDVENANKETPLLFAADNNAVAAVTCLIKHGADINHSSKLGYTALMRAAGRGSVEITQLLLGHDANTYLVTRKGNSALFFAVDKNQENIVKTLISRDPGMMSIYETRSPLERAIQKNISITKYLIEKGVCAYYELGYLLKLTENCSLEIQRLILQEVSHLKVPQEIEQSICEINTRFKEFNFKINSNSYRINEGINLIHKVKNGNIALDFSNNNLDDKDLSKICVLLTNYSIYRQVTEINFLNNNISADGIIYLIDIIQHCPIASLNLCKNPLTSVAIADLLHGSLLNINLTDIKFSRNKIDQSILEQFAAATNLKNQLQVTACRIQSVARVLLSKAKNKDSVYFPVDIKKYLIHLQSENLHVSHVDCILDSVLSGTHFSTKKEFIKYVFQDQKLLQQHLSAILLQGFSPSLSLTKGA